jgi:hypothetical protein
LVLLIEIMGWIASVLIVGAYGLNLVGKLEAQSKIYILANLVGGVFFVINTYYHEAYPSMVVNIIWIILAGYSIIKSQKAG